MAASLGRVYKIGLLKSNYGTLFNQVHNFSTAKQWSRGRKVLLACLGVTAGGISALIYALDQSVKAFDMVAHPPTYKWGFYGMFSALDHRSLRRGWEVYKNVCSACHSLQYMAYRHLVGVTHTEEEVKAIAAEVQVQDGPDDQGNYFMRPGKLSDYIPPPYPNEEAARAANNGAYPPDLTFIINGTEHGENYVFSLLTGYCDPPAGIPIREGQYFNPYFVGGALGMPQILYDEVIEYEDGTPASASQLAKDIVEFLMWTSNSEHDERKRLTIKLLGISSIVIPLLVYWKRHKWTTVKNTKILFTPRHKPPQQ
ncbi:cytochrome c1, heme protein, mitochondrial isoform X2 [Apis cerana]|uniref:cytochrome c1, heme protein, mitochondrial isoform X2 n=1 Tax=Apis cerana TaxID=7461 RepID=UPI0007E2D08D|nr:cytochrome c1, heme protein, mitochondrial isoform X2 [Apis cerana]XP_028519826.1 cytochrome c1, heme protein, mitochondrial isoform X2 [Apis cerana]